MGYNNNFTMKMKCEGLITDECKVQEDILCCFMKLRAEEIVVCWCVWNFAFNKISWCKEILQFMHAYAKQKEKTKQSVVKKKLKKGFYGKFGSFFKNHSTPMYWCVIKNWQTFTGRILYVYMNDFNFSI